MMRYVLFLNEEDDQSYYNDAPSVFEGLVAKYPEDANAHFWLGYIYNIILNDIVSAQKEMEKCLQLSEDFPYACVVLSGLVGDVDSIILLKRGLKRQPNNFRMLRQLAGILMREGRRSEAKEVLSIILDHRAYVETNYGIMNNYINDVLTAANHEITWRTECQSIFDAL